MKELTTSFQQHDLVWAKIQNYPWWPGKIIEIFEQKKSLIFKISFYADPTYSYLKEDALIPFEQFEEQFNAQYSINQQLKKAIDLANNAFEKKKLSQQTKNTSLTNQTQILNSIFHSQSPIFQQNLQKLADQFQQSTIHADYQIENQSKDDFFQQKTVNIQALLMKYKLDKIPSLPKLQNKAQKMIKDQVNQSQSQSDSQDPNQDFQIKRLPKSKNLKAKGLKKFIVKKKKVELVSEQQRKVKFMKRLCSFLIEKQIQSSLSRQITLQVIKRFQEFKAKNLISQNKQRNQHQIYLKYFEFLNRIDSSMTYEEKLIGIFNSIQISFYENGKRQKYEQQKTQTLYLQFQIEDVY